MTVPATTKEFLEFVTGFTATGSPTPTLDQHGGNTFIFNGTDQRLNGSTPALAQFSGVQHSFAAWFKSEGPITANGSILRKEHFLILALNLNCKLVGVYVSRLVTMRQMTERGIRLQLDLMIVNGIILWASSTATI